MNLQWRNTVAGALTWEANVNMPFILVAVL